MRIVALALGWAGCKSVEAEFPSRPVEDIRLELVGPSALVPGSTLVLEGADFLPELAGPTTLILDGTLAGHAADARLSATFIDYDRMEVAWPGSSATGGQGWFAGDARVTTDSAYDGRRHVSARLGVDLEVTDVLVPVLDAVEDDGRHVNDPIVLRGDAMLLGGGEGQAVAVVEGCFTASGSGSCKAVGPVEVPALPVQALERTAVVFPFAPEIAGIEPGQFEGTVRVVNRHASGEEVASDRMPLDHRIDPPSLSGLSPGAASLGQYVAVEGGGFVGPSAGDPAAVTLLELDGRFTAPGAPGIDVVLTLVGEFEPGIGLRYVINEEDALGRLVDVRAATGTFSGTARPIVAYGSSEVEGSAVSVQLELLPVKQVVWLRFLPSFVESLRQFGLRSATDAVTDRIVQVVQRDYTGVNLEVRLDEPTDFALYSVVELSGPDPNGIGLLGYDNTPGKDVGNLRLYDNLGGVNALTQLDGYPGYGGVFIDSLFAYSDHPPSREADEGLAERAFDDLFDPVRPDVKGGKKVSADEAADLMPIDDNSTCPGNGRRKQVGCAVFALGNLVGTTLSHEIAHSLGLADPEGESFHNTGDWTDALMDGGSSRTFAERAEVDGQGPGLFCQVNYDYLRAILPTDEPDPIPERQGCF